MGEAQSCRKRAGIPARPQGYRASIRKAITARASIRKRAAVSRFVARLLIGQPISRFWQCGFVRLHRLTAVNAWLAAGLARATLLACVSLCEDAEGSVPGATMTAQCIDRRMQRADTWRN